jgi:DNA-binding CsgD family transcriptional regulator
MTDPKQLTPREREVLWYRKHGRYPKERIVRDKTGAEYVIGDWAWNRKQGICPTCGHPCGRKYERIEERMKDAILSANRRRMGKAGSQRLSDGLL